MAESESIYPKSNPNQLRCRMYCLHPPDRPATPTLTLDDHSLQLGDPATFNCTSASSDVTYEFLHNGLHLADSADGSFVITSSSTADNGDYTCVTHSGVWQSDTSNVLNVLSE